MRKFILSCIIIFSASGLFALNLDECRRLAKENYPLIKQNSLIEMSSEFDIINAKREYLPQISIYGQASWQNRVSQFPDQMLAMYSASGMNIEGLTKEQYKVGAEISQVIWDGGNISNKIRSSKAAAVSETASLEVDLYAINQRVNDLYFGALIASARLNVINSQIQLLQKNCDILQSMYNDGVATKSDLLRIKAELAKAEQSQISARESLDAYRQMLSLFIGREISDQETLEIPQENDIIGENFDNRPEIKYFKASCEYLETQQNFVSTKLRPVVTGFATAFYGKPGYNMFDDMFTGELSFNFMVGVNASWNISNFFYNKNNSQKIRVGCDKIQVSQDVFNFNSSIQATSAKSASDCKKQQYEIDSELLQTRVEIRELTESKLQNGTASTSDLIADILAESSARLQAEINNLEYLQKQYQLRGIYNN